MGSQYILDSIKSREQPVYIRHGHTQDTSVASSCRKIIMTKTLMFFAIFAVAVQGLDIKWKFYQKAQKRCAEIGEEVTFKWGGIGHNVVEVNSKKDFDNCTGFEESEDGETGPVTVSFNRPGKHYFVCGVGGHCLHGNQKVELIVAESCESSNKRRGGRN